MAHQISEEIVAYDATRVLEEWFEGYMDQGDGRQYKVVQIEHEDTRMTIEVQGSRYLDVVEEQFEIEILVRKVHR